MELLKGNNLCPKVVDKKSKLTVEYHNLFAEQSEKEGQVAELKRTIKSVERELQDPKWKNAAKNYKEQTIEHKLRTEMVSDLNKYYKALDCAILKFHSQKMKVVNKIIRELWKQTYKGNDIDYIEIKTDDGFDGPNYGAEKRKVHNYRVVMFKQDAELDMRGRCSAGQKVLACLIIRPRGDPDCQALLRLPVADCAIEWIHVCIDWLRERERRLFYFVLQRKN